MYYNFEHYPDPTAATAQARADREIRAVRAAREMEERMQEVTFQIPGPPRGKGRPRARVMQISRKATAHIYTPHETQDYERFIRGCFEQQVGGAPCLLAPVRVDIAAEYPVPKSYSKRKREQCLMGAVPHTGKPDLDNVAKIVLDALNGLAYMDDTQVTELHVCKRYGASPRVIVRIRGDVAEEQIELEKVGESK